MTRRQAVLRFSGNLPARNWEVLYFRGGDRVDVSGGTCQHDSEERTHMLFMSQVSRTLTVAKPCWKTVQLSREKQRLSCRGCLPGGSPVVRQSQIRLTRGRHESLRQKIPV